jgi:hypothetical protein
MPITGREAEVKKLVLISQVLKQRLLIHINKVKNSVVGSVCKYGTNFL